MGGAQHSYVWRFSRRMRGRQRYSLLLENFRPEFVTQFTGDIDEFMEYNQQMHTTETIDTDAYFETGSDGKTLMVSVLIRSKGVSSTVAFLQERGFLIQPSWTPIEVDLEIAGGYFSRMRGDRHSSNQQPSLFQPQPLLDLFDDPPILARSDVVMAFGPWRDEKFRGREKSPVFDSDGRLVCMLQMPEWRNVLYALGPPGLLHEAIDELFSHPGLPDGARCDLEIARQWWDEPVYSTGLASVTVIRR